MRMFALPKIPIDLILGGNQLSELLSVESSLALPLFANLASLSTPWLEKASESAVGGRFPG